MSASRKVLVVDDDPVVGKSFNRVLAAKGYAVITAQNGEDALRKLSAEKYDLVYTDIKMPGMSGIEVAERVKASQPWLPVVVITGYGTLADQQRAEAAGVSGFLNKPLSPAIIESSASKALAEQEQFASIAAPVFSEDAAARESVVTSTGNRAKNIALLLAAPFIGLAYIIVMPLVGLGALGWVGAKALMESETARQIALAASAPFIGLAFVIALPVAGLGALTWIGTKAAFKD